ncbi:MAG TPA: hypothetical protein VMQ67_01590 [Candidatus Saccharimonadales bacterium]|nr:hypothetical protein [Candidatus Saccharimonadales bacterium]
MIFQAKKCRSVESNELRQAIDSMSNLRRINADGRDAVMAEQAPKRFEMLHARVQPQVRRLDLHPELHPVPKRTFEAAIRDDEARQQGLQVKVTTGDQADAATLGFR